jgi:hypothetical protein
MRFGAVKVYAHRFVNGQAIPIFRDRAANAAINEHVERIRRARTRRRRNPGRLDGYRVDHRCPV